MEKVLVTGATGFVGRNLTKALVDQGFEVRVLARREPQEPWANRVEWVQGDITNSSDLIRATEGIHGVFHLAGLVSYQSKDRKSMEKVNVEGTRTLVKACLENKISRFIHFSSVVAVGSGRTPEEILNETSPFNLSHLNLGYWETKKAAEEVVLEAVKSHGLSALCLNPSNIYGAGDATKGSRSKQIRVAQGRLKVFPPGGVSVIGIRDVVSATIAAYHLELSGERIILSGENLKIRELFQLIAESGGVRPPHLELPAFLIRLLGEIGEFLSKLSIPFILTRESAWSAILFHWYDHTKATEVLGFKPSPARQVIQESVDWMRSEGLLESEQT